MKIETGRVLKTSKNWSVETAQVELVHFSISITVQFLF